MATFVDLNTTAATLNPGFSFSAYTAQMDAAGSSLVDAVDTIAYYSPTSEVIGSTSAHLGWADGTTLDATVSSLTNTSATLSEFSLESGDGAWIDVTGSIKVTADSSGIDVSNATVREADYGNDQAAQYLFGSATVNVDTGALGGKLSSLVLAWHNDNPATPGDEWLYVKLNGSVAMTGSIDDGLTGLSGKVTSFEWGTLTATGNEIQSYSPARVISGVQIDASHIIDNLETSGFDSLLAGLYAGNDKIDGTAGDDYLDASTGNDKVYGEGGDDIIIGGLGNDQLFGGAGDDFISGGAGNDKIVDDSGNNEIYDTDGNASIVTGAGDDFITTGAGNDKVVAGEGLNDIDTGLGNDNIVTGGGDDFIWAGAGNDKIVAGAGNDWIVSGEGADKIVAGLGDDVFVFDNVAVGGMDNIADFNAAEDILAFDTDVFSSLAGGITADNLVLGKVALDANDFLVLDGGKLFYDADGNGAGAAVQIATLKGVLTGISAANFADMDSLLV